MTEFIEVIFASCLLDIIDRKVNNTEPGFIWLSAATDPGLPGKTAVMGPVTGALTEEGCNGEFRRSPGSGFGKSVWEDTQKDESELASKAKNGWAHS